MHYCVNNVDSNICLVYLHNYDRENVYLFSFQSAEKQHEDVLKVYDWFLSHQRLINEETVSVSTIFIIRSDLLAIGRCFMLLNIIFSL